MSKRTEITCTYQFSDTDAISCAISIPSNYPDAIAEAATTVLRVMRAELADVIQQQHTQA